MIAKYVATVSASRSLVAALAKRVYFCMKHGELWPFFGEFVFLMSTHLRAFYQAADPGVMYRASALACFAECVYYFHSVVWVGLDLVLVVHLTKARDTTRGSVSWKSEGDNTYTQYAP